MNEAQMISAKRQAYENQCIGNQYIPSDVREGTLNRLANQIRESIARLNDMAAMLNNHADRVHGDTALCGVSSLAGSLPSRSGALGDLEDAIDHLERTCGYVGDAANRNCALA